MKRLIFLVALLGLSACGGEGGNEIDPSVKIKFTLASLPQVLPVNRASTGDDEDEYAWTALFSLGNSEFVEVGLVYHTGISPSYGVDQLAIDKFTVRISKGDGLFVYFSSYIYTSSRYVSVSGNAITLTIPRDAVHETSGINQTTSILFRTKGFDDTGKVHSDNYPIGKFTTIPPDGKFTDDIGEAEIGGQQHLDLVSMEVLIIKF